MASIEELGQLWKQQYPGKFDNRTDREVGLELKMNFPSRFLEYRDSAMVVRESTAIVPEVLPPVSQRYSVRSPSEQQFFKELEDIGKTDITLYSSLKENVDLQRNYKSLVEFYNPNHGRFTSWWRRGKGEARNKFLTVVNEQQRLLIEQAAMLERAADEEIKRKLEINTRQLELKIFIARNAAELRELRLKADLIENALGAGMTAQDFSQINKEATQSKIRATEHERKILLEHKIKTDERKQAVDLAVMQGSFKQHQEINKLQELIDSVQLEISGIENNPNYDAVAKLGMIRDREQTIKTYREDKRAREAGLLQNTYGKDV